MATSTSVDIAIVHGLWALQARHLMDTDLPRSIGLSDFSAFHQNHSRALHYTRPLSNMSIGSINGLVESCGARFLGIV